MYIKQGCLSNTTIVLESEIQTPAQVESTDLFAALVAEINMVGSENQIGSAEEQTVDDEVIEPDVENLLVPQLMTQPPMIFPAEKSMENFADEVVYKSVGQQVAQLTDKHIDKNIQLPIQNTTDYVEVQEKSPALKSFDTIIANQNDNKDSKLLINTILKTKEKPIIMQNYAMEPAEEVSQPSDLLKENAQVSDYVKLDNTVLKNADPELMLTPKMQSIENPVRFEKKPQSKSVPQAVNFESHNLSLSLKNTVIDNKMEPLVYSDKTTAFTIEKPISNDANNLHWEVKPTTDNFEKLPTKMTIQVHEKDLGDITAQIEVVDKQSTVTFVTQRIEATQILHEKASQLQEIFNSAEIPLKHSQIEQQLSQHNEQKQTPNYMRSEQSFVEEDTDKVSTKKELKKIKESVLDTYA